MSRRDSMQVRLLLLAVCSGAASLVLGGAAVGEPHGVQAGGTFRVGVGGGVIFNAVDPALAIDTGQLLRPACGSLMAYPDRPLPAGLVLAPELAARAPGVAKDRKTYRFTIRKDARFSTGAPVTARDVAHTLERILDPNVKSGIAADFSDIVGAQNRLEGKASTLAGVVARGRTLTLRLTKPLADFPARTSEVCVVPASLPPDPEGAKAPLPSAAPYYVSQYVADQHVVLERNRFYRGKRPHHVDRIDIDLAADPATLLSEVTGGKIQYAPAGPWIRGRERELARRYGVNKSRFFVLPGLETHMFMLNTSRPLFRNNVALRRAVNFAVDRRALIATEHGTFAETPSDKYLPRAMPGFSKARVYPFRPNLRRARALARGHRRSGKAILYTCTDLDCTGPAQVLKQDLKKIGVDVVIKEFPRPLQVPKLATPGEPYDIARVWFFGSYFDPAFLASTFDGRTIGRPGAQDFSYYKSAAYDRQIDRASRLSGIARDRAYGHIDARLARDGAPAIGYANGNQLTLVSANAGCVVVNPVLDLTAVCLK